MSNVDQGYSFGAAAQILGIAESKLRYWSQVGFVGPSRREGTRQLFTFADLVSARAAKELVDRGFRAVEIRRALEKVRSLLPAVDRPLDRLRIAFDGDTLVVVDGDGAFQIDGQRVFDFGLGELAQKAGIVVSAHTGASQDAGSARCAYDWFAEGLRLEGDAERDSGAAVAYEKALSLDPGLAAAHTNLGAIAYRRGKLETARHSFEAALAHDPDQPEARYNLASLQFESGDIELAAAELRRVVQGAPQFADAHYNLAAALERLGSKRQAREHLERFLALTEASGQGDPTWIEEARIRLLRL